MNKKQILQDIKRIIVIDESNFGHLKCLTQEAVEHSKRKRPQIARPGPISHIDFETYHPGEEETKYSVIQVYAHETCKEMARKVGFEQIRPLYQALIERGIVDPKQITNSCGETIEREARLEAGETSLEELCKGYSEVIFNPVNPEAKYICHDVGLTNIWLSETDNPEARLRRLFNAILNHGVIGDVQGYPSGRQTYLKKHEIDEVQSEFELDYGGICGDGSPYTLRFHVDVRKLLQLRDLYHDPENIWTSSADGDNPEYLRTFMVFGGIPVCAIHSIDAYTWETPCNKRPRVE